MKAPPVAVKVEKEEKKEGHKEAKSSKGQSSKEKRKHHRHEKRDIEVVEVDEQVRRKLSDPSISGCRRGVSELRSLRQRDDFSDIPTPPPCPR